MEPRFSKKPDDFFNTVRTRVNDYLSVNNDTKFDNGELSFKAILFLSLSLLDYVLLLQTSPGLFYYVLWGILGFLFPCIGFNVMHDGAHGSISENKFWNTLAGYSLNLMGCSVFHWKVKHNYFHHTYTNINDHDDDINIGRILRTNIYQLKKWFHSYQHIYAPVLYMFTYVMWVWFQDFEKYFTGKVGTQKIPSHFKMKLEDHIIFWMTKIIHPVLFLVVPMTIHGVESVLIGYGILCVICGLFIAIVFQLAHVVPVTFEPVPDENSELESFGKHQLSTTADFAVNSKVAKFLFGGLNYQVEHHLFPKISHRHYPAIQKIVERTAKEYDLSYKVFSTFWSGIRGHFSQLKTVGNAP